jgi:tetratricopeptide (TPR) repeat protein
MPGKLLAPALVVLLLAALALDVRRGARLKGADKRVKLVEATSTVAAARRDAASQAVLRRNLEILRDAAAMDPADVRVPLARGSVLLLLGRLDEAIASYRAALELEPRPEIHLNLGRALAAAGRPAEAEPHFALVRQVDWHLSLAIPR